MASRVATKIEEEVNLKEDTIRGGTVSTNIELTTSIETDLILETSPSTEDSPGDNQLIEAKREIGHGLSLGAGVSPKEEDNNDGEVGGVEDIEAGAATEAGTHLLAAFTRNGDHEEQAELPGAPGAKPQETSNASGA